ncbi:MAG: BREX system ATP-binding domain-containing protein, partial [Polyangiaceae bacterium]
MLFVGRERELGEITQRLDEAREGRGSLVFFVGEPGIGKTRLADAVATNALSRGFRVGWGRAWESGGAPAYYPWQRVFDAHGLKLPDASSATAVESDAARFQLFRHAADDLRRASAEAPRLIVLDDLHVTDTSSLELLLFVARELRTMRAVVIGTYRDVEVRLSPAIAELLAKAAREGAAFPLRRLGRTEVGDLVRSSGEALSSDVEESIWRSTQGNPLFVEEVMRLLAADPALAQTSAIPIPHGVREVIRQRLALLDEKALRLLDVAAVMGVEFDVALLAVTAGAGDVEVNAMIAHARRVGVLVDTGQGRERFGHALIRDALYNDLPGSRRTEIHSAVADAIERSRGADARLSEIAHHTLLAGPAEADRLIERSLRAARAFIGAHAHEDAVRWLERADAALATLPDANERMGELWLALGDARTRAGDAAGSADACLRVIQLARTLENGPLFARAALAYGAEFTVGSTNATLKALLEEALARLGSSHRDLRVRVEARLAASLQPAPDPETVAAMALRAIEEAKELGDDATLLDVIHMASAALIESVLVREGASLQLEAVRLATRLGDKAKLLRAYMRLIFYLAEEGDFSAVDAYIDAYETAARATSQGRHIWPVPLFRAMRASMEGRFRDAETLVAEADEILATWRDPAFFQVQGMNRYFRLRAEERGPEIAAQEPEFLATCAGWNAGEDYVRMFRAALRATTGDRAAARDDLGRLSLESTPCRIRVSLGMVAGAVLACGDREKASAFYDRLLPSAQMWLVFGFAGFSVDSTFARLLGGFATLLGRFADAEKHYADALQIAESAAARPEFARVSIEYGHMLLERGGDGDADRAADLFASARPICEELGLAQSLARLPVAIGSPRPARSSLPPDRASLAVTLTSEGDVWALQVGSEILRLKDNRGLQYLARLVREPHRSFHALDLAGASESGELGDAGEALDPEARAAYKKRLAELDDDVRDAEAANDRARLIKAR